MTFEDDIKSKALRPLAHAFGVLARQIDSGECELPKSIEDAEKITEKLINQAYERLMLLIKQEQCIDNDKKIAACFIDIPTGHKITVMTSKKARHDKKCSSMFGFTCDCEIYCGAQLAVDEVKKRIIAIGCK